MLGGGGVIRNLKFHHHICWILTWVCWIKSTPSDPIFVQCILSCSLWEPEIAQLVQQLQYRLENQGIRDWFPTGGRIHTPTVRMYRMLSSRTHITLCQHVSSLHSKTHSATHITLQGPILYCIYISVLAFKGPLPCISQLRIHTSRETPEGFCQAHTELY